MPTISRFQHSCASEVRAKPSHGCFAGIQHSALSRQRFTHQNCHPERGLSVRVEGPAVSHLAFSTWHSVVKSVIPSDEGPAVRSSHARARPLIVCHPERSEAKPSGVEGPLFWQDSLNRRDLLCQVSVQKTDANLGHRAPPSELPCRWSNRATTGLGKNLWEQQTLCRAIVDHAEASFVASNTVMTTCL